MTVRVTCINKDGGFHENPHVAISRFGWRNPQTNEAGFSEREPMWRFVTDGGEAYVQDAAGNAAWLQARTSQHGTHYLQTVADGKLTDNLLYLNECPI